MKLASPRLAYSLIQNAWVRSFAWRGDIFFYRLGDFLNPLTQIIIWNAVFATTAVFAGYDKQTMISYVLTSAVFIALSRNWLTYNTATDIKEGRLNQYLVKPVSYLQYSVWVGIGRTLLAMIFALIAISVLAFIFRHDLYVPEPAHLAVSILIALLAYFMNLLISIAVGLTAFWLTSIDGFSDAYYLLRQFLSGGMFPLNIVGPWFLLSMRALPFAYSGYIPSQVFLGKMSIVDGLVSVLVEIAWLVALYFILQILWRVGIKKYEAIGI